MAQTVLVFIQVHLTKYAYLCLHILLTRTIYTKLPWQESSATLGRETSRRRYSATEDT